MTVGVEVTQIIINWLIITALFADGAANAVASGFKYVIDVPFTFNVPVVKQFVPVPPVCAKISVTEMLRFNVDGTFVIVIDVSAPLTPAI